MSDENRRPPMRAPAQIRWSDDAKQAAQAQPAPAAAAVVPTARAGMVPPQVRAAQARAVASATPRAVAASPPSSAALADRPTAAPTAFFPLEPRNIQEAGIDPHMVLLLILRTMSGQGGMSGRQLAEATGLPLGIVRDALDQGKQHKLIEYRSTTTLGDYVTQLTDAGLAKAVESRKITAYVGPAPVPYDHYLQVCKLQALADKNPGPEDLQRAFSDLYVSEDLFDRLGPAVSSGKAMFLFGEPGNGKTSLAERMTRCFGDSIWIPQALDIGGHIVQLYDPAIHRQVELDPNLHVGRTDRRWIRIQRPTVIAGGELTLDMLDLAFDEETRVCGAPLQLKANMGTFVIDDFGRGNTKPKDLLNRWIFPLEKRIDFQRLPDGRKVEVPFDCLLVFSTNLEPRDLADEAFLRRIPYKINVGDPMEEEFVDLLNVMAKKLGVQVEERSLRYLVDRHYKSQKRPMRMCHPRDLLLQVQHLCEYERRPVIAGVKEWDRVVGNYFGY